MFPKLERFYNHRILPDLIIGNINVCTLQMLAPLQQWPKPTVQYSKNYVLCSGRYICIIYTIDFIPSFHTKRVKIQIYLLLLSLTFHNNDNYFSTNENKVMYYLRSRRFIKKNLVWNLNPWPIDWNSAALPTELTQSWVQIPDIVLLTEI